MVNIEPSLDVEPQVAAVLARKRQKRNLPAYKPRARSEIQSLTQSFIEQQNDSYAGHKVQNLLRLTGGASKELFRFALIAPGGSSQSYVLRMNPPESVIETSLSREFEALRAFEGIVPVPKAICIDADGSHFGTPSMITSLVTGVTKPLGAPGGGGGVSGLGINVGTPWRKLLAEPFIKHLVAIHNFDCQSADLPSYSVPNAYPQQAARRQVDWWTQAWIDDVVDPNPLIVTAENWMRNNLPSCDEIVFLHSDYRTGNYLIDEQNQTISAILDWELSHLGDFHDDIAWVISKVFGHLDEQGQFLVSGLMPRQEFLDRYMQATGRNINPKTLHFYEILNNYKVAVELLASAYRTAIEAHNHQSVLQIWLVSCGHVFISEVCRLLEEGPRS